MVSTYVLLHKSDAEDGVTVEVGAVVLKALVPVHVLLAATTAANVVLVSTYVLLHKSDAEEGVTVEVGAVVLKAFVPVHVLLAATT